MITTNIKQAFNNIQHHVLRSFLTLLGVLVGTAAVVALLTGSELATENALNQFKKLGVDLIGVSFSEQHADENHTQENLNIAQIEQLRSQDILQISPYTMHYSPLVYNANNTNGSIIGVTEEIQKVLKFNAGDGRFISNLDNRSLYCVLGNQLAKQLSYHTENLIGEQIRINSLYFTVIGVLEETDRNLFLMTDPNEAVFIPLNTSLQVYKNAQINHVIFKINSEKKVSDMQETIQQYFETIKPHIQLSFRSPETIVENMQNQNHIFKILLGFIGCISLIVGGIGVMNIMLVSVTERKREIGIRMAVGASQQDILYLFLAESAILTLLGGIAGILIGEFVALITAKISHWPFHFVTTPVLIGFLVSLLVGIFFGYYPAFKASQSDPIEILRAA